jgi:integral membrane protein
MSVTWLRIIAIIEGISYLLLLGIAMPLKYLWAMPEAVRVVGMAHGVLFMLFCLALAWVWWERRWSLARVSVLFVSALLPLATFFLDGRLKRWGSETRHGQANVVSHS